MQAHLSRCPALSAEHSSAPAPIPRLFGSRKAFPSIRVTVTWNPHQSSTRMPECAYNGDQIEAGTITVGEWQAKELGAKLQHRRKELGISATRLSRQAGIDPGTVLRLEKGQIRNPNIATLQAIADCLGIAVANLLSDGGGASAGKLPALGPYLHIKYPGLPPQAIAAAESYLDYLQSKYSKPTADAVSSESRKSEESR